MTERHARVVWRCRRGTRELDLLLEAYLGRVYETAEPAEQAAFEQLLTLPDPELSLLLTGLASNTSHAINALVARIRALVTF